MRRLRDILSEAEKDKDKKEKEKKVVFVETDPQTAFPDDCVTAIQKQINTMSKDMEVQWKSAIELVDAAMKELDVPKPGAHLKSRWSQYRELIGYAVKNLYEARGLHGGWSSSY